MRWIFKHFWNYSVFILLFRIFYGALWKVLFIICENFKEIKRMGGGAMIIGTLAYTFYLLLTPLTYHIIRKLRRHYFMLYTSSMSNLFPPRGEQFSKFTLRLHVTYKCNGYFYYVLRPLIFIMYFPFPSYHFLFLEGTFSIFQQMGFK